MKYNEQLIKKIYIYSHNDLDGVSASFPIKEKFPNVEIKTIFSSYARIDSNIEKFLNRKMDLSEVVFITDISISEENITKLKERAEAGQLIFFIDHHAINIPLNVNEWSYVEDVKEGVKTCATTLVIDVLKDKFDYEPSQSLVEYAEMVRQYDTWDWAELGNKKAKELNDFFFMNSFKEYQEIMLGALSSNTDEFIFPEKYQVLMDYEEKRISLYFAAKERDMRIVEMFGRKVAFIYAESYLSELGNYICENHDVDFTLMLNLSSKRGSVRSIKPDCDCNEFAGLLGGGGHPPAAGFLVTEDNINHLIHL